MDDTINFIVNSEVSVVRYGDGELKIIDGDDIFFQPGSKLLARRLKEILVYNDKNIFVCLPDIFNDLSIYTDRGKKYTADIVAERRLKWYSYMDMDKTYGNAFLSRFYSGFRDSEKSAEWIESIKKLWNNKKMFIVEGHKSRLGVGNDLFSNAKSIRRLLCPSTDAFGHYHEILEKVKRFAANDEIVFIALGPTATVLAFDLSQLGFRAIDSGHIDIEYEWYLRGDKKHGNIKNKYVSEAENGDIVEEVDESYLLQIVTTIGE